MASIKVWSSKRAYRAVDAKSLFDRIIEITNIVWRTQSKAEELPTGTKPPLLIANEENDKKKGSDKEKSDGP